MKRIMVLGVSSGVGKSTFARQLGELLEIEVTHLDKLHWKPGWVEAPKQEFIDQQKHIVEKEEWIIEGNYSSTYDLRASRADTIIYLELPLTLCLFRVIKRWWTYKGTDRPDLGEGCPEKLDAEFLKFILTTYHSRKGKMRARFRAFQQEDPAKQVIPLRSKRDIESFLEFIAYKE
ncbi:topology modulation protein [Halobacillus fulvus]|nr:topology modulation protein [Halobacillus fulvus]